MRISDWSSDVCSSDLRVRGRTPGHAFRQTLGHAGSRADDGVGRNAVLTPGDNLLKRAVGNVLRSCASSAMICSRCQEQPREIAAGGDGLLKVLVVGDDLADRNSGISDAVPINDLAALRLESREFLRMAGGQVRPVMTFGSPLDVCRIVEAEYVVYVQLGVPETGRTEGGERVVQNVSVS